MRRSTSPKLSVVGNQPTVKPLPSPKHLAGVGLELWHRVVAEYEFTDPASLEVLAQACFAVTRAERCRAQIDKDGEMIRLRAHPCIREKTQCRALACRLLQRLGLDLEPVREPMAAVPHPHGRR
jgi:hypothetical protein